MRGRAWKRWTASAVLLTVLIGCGSVLQHLAKEARSSAGTGGFATAGGGFSDAPVSPGGTGGIIEDQVEVEGEETQSFFRAYQIDPEAEDSAGPKFVISEDINKDGLLDLVSAWTESQPVQLHLQQRDEEDNISFLTITLGGTLPIALVAGVQVGHINNDDWLDVVVLVKSTGRATICPPPPTEEVIGVMDGLIIVLFNPGSAAAIPDGDRWFQTILPASNEYPGIDEVGFYEAATKPEFNGYTSLAVGQVDGSPGDDIVVAFNAAECESTGQKPPKNTIELYPNPGPEIADIGDAWIKVVVETNLPKVKDVYLYDVDADGDLDVVSTWTNLVSGNVRWFRNPFIPHTPGGPSGTAAVHQGTATWQDRPIGHVPTGADLLAIGDVDADGFDDVLVRSADGQIVMWFRRPTELAIQPIFPPPDPVPDRANFPWDVFALAQLDRQEPEAISIGDITGDGINEVLLGAEGAVFWYDGTTGTSFYDEWSPNPVIRDNPPETTDPGASTQQQQQQPPGTPGASEPDASTHINRLLIVDLDGDGRNDIVGTLDRRANSGLTNDRLVWYRNIRRLEGEE